MVGNSTAVAEMFVDMKTTGFTKAAGDFEQISLMAKKFNLSTRRLITSLRESGKVVSSNGVLYKNKLGGGLQSADRNTTELIRSTKKFRAEMLSMLFVGMAISGMFRSYITEALNMGGTTELLRTVLGSAVLDFLEFAGVLDFVDKIIEWADENPRLAGGLISVAFAIGLITTAIGMLALVDFIAITASLAGMTTSLKNLFTLKSAGKFIGSLIVIYLILKGLSLLIEKNREGWERVKGILLILAGIAIAIFLIFGGWIPLVIGIGLAILAWASRFQPVKDAFTWVWNKITAIYDIAKQLFSGNTVGIGGKIKGLFGLAEGGIVTKPTAALIGEKGPEAVIPLNQLGTFAPNVTVNANVASGVDITRLANTLAGVYSDQLRSQGITRRAI